MVIFMILFTDDGGFLCRWKVSHNSHEEHLNKECIKVESGGKGRVHRHIEHSRYPQCDLLPGLARHHEDEQGDDVDQESGKDVVDHVECSAAPENDVVALISR